MSYEPLPTASQVGATRQLITNTKSAIAAAEQQIREHETRIAELRTQILGFREEIVAHEAYLAPIRRLPFEVLGEIVTLCATDPDAPVQVLRDLASICKTWRDATLRTPKAWTKIVIRLFSPWDTKAKAATSRTELASLRDVQEWYDRSGRCRKDVTLRTGGAEGDLTSVIDLLASRAAELRSLSSAIPCGRLLSCAMPNLQTLNMDAFYLDDKVMLALITSSPRLSWLGVYSSERKVDGLRAGYLRTGLTSLDMSGITPRQFFQLIRADGGFVNLQTLSVSFLSYTIREPPVAGLSLGSVSLPRLRRLFLSTRVDDFKIPFLEILHMPLLESLALGLHPYDPAQRPSTKAVAAFLRFPDDGELQLRELRLQELWISDADLVRFLKRTPRLELLAVVNGKTSDKVVSALTSKQNRSHWLCPRLSRICVIADASLKSEKFKVSKDAMGALITARLRANQTPLQGSPPPVARMMNVRVEDDNVVFDGILSPDWRWEQDETSYVDRTIKLSYPGYEKARWWHFTSR